MLLFSAFYTHQSFQTLLTFITLSLYRSTSTIFPINQFAYITPTPFTVLLLPLQRNLKPLPIILAPCPFHLTSCTQQISTQCLFKVSDISPHFPDIDPTFHVENRIPNCTLGNFPSFEHECTQLFFRGSVLSF